MDLRAVRRRCETRLRKLNLPQPFTTEALARSLAERRGRPLMLLPKGAGGGPCGVWFALDGADYVFFDGTTSGLHREHIIAHELAHLMWDHGTSEVIAPDVVADLLPDLDPSTVRRMLSRSSYSTVEEQEAEVLASMVVQQAEDAGRAAAEPVSSDPEVQRLRGMLGRRRGSRG